MKRLLLICTLLLSISADESLETLTMLTLEELMDVQISTGSFLELDLKKTPFSMTVIESEQILLTGGKSLSDLLEIYVPGFQYMPNKWNGTLWGMRGVAGDRNDKIVVLINGIKQNMQTFHGFATEYSLGLMSDIDRIEVLRGPAGLVYGSGAIAAVVNIVTKGDDETENYISIKTDYTAAEGFIGKSIEGGFSDSLFTNTTITVHAGIRTNDGYGENTVKVFGFYEMGKNPIPKEGNYTAGSYGKTDGNWLGTVKLEHKNLEMYSRITREVDDVAATFYPSPWYEEPNEQNHKTYIKEQLLQIDTADDGNYAINVTDNFHSWHWVPQRRKHLRDNVTFALKYNKDIGQNTLKLNTSIIGTTNRLLNSEFGIYKEEILSTNGERKFNVDGNFLIKQVTDLQLAVGFNFGVFKAGDDLSGQNSYWIPQTKYIKDVTYYNSSFFTEAIYSFNSKWQIEGGGRIDHYTDGADRSDAIFSPKLSILYEPSKKHLFKLIGQSSSNNADVLTYELHPAVTTKEKGWTYELAPLYGKDVLDSVSYTELKGLVGQLISPISESEKHNTKPERSYDIELASQHLLNEKVLLESSLSYTMFRDLLLWSSTMQQNISISAYDGLSFELGGKVDLPKMLLQFSNSVQVPMNFNNSPNVLYTRPLFVPGWDEEMQEWVPVDTTPDGVSVGDTTLYQDIVKYQVSADGHYYNNLHTVITKGVVDWSPHEKITIHTDARIFWGLWGRRPIHDEYVEEANGNVEFFNFASDRTYFRPTVKWNAAISANLKNDKTITLYGYNLLGTAENQDGARWHHMTAASQLGYYTLDQRSFALQLTKKF